MNVSLTPELERFVAEKLRSGKYNSVSDVVSEALRLLEEQDRLRAAGLAEFNNEIRERLASLNRGEFVEPAEVRERFKQKSQARRAQQP
jgi:antitoxin ParD1/3/4